MDKVLKELHKDIYEDIAINPNLELMQNTVYLLSQLGLNIGEYYFKLNEKNKLESLQLTLDYNKTEEDNTEVEFSDFAYDCFYFFRDIISNVGVFYIMLFVEGLAYAHYLKHIMRLRDCEIFTKLTELNSSYSYFIKPNNNNYIIYLINHWYLKSPKDDLSDLLNKIEFNLEIRKIGNSNESYSINCPFTDKIGDYIEVYITREDTDCYKISDDKYTNHLLEETFQQQLKIIPSDIPILENSKELYMLTNKKQLQVDLINFLKYMIILNN